MFIYFNYLVCKEFFVEVEKYSNCIICVSGNILQYLLEQIKKLTEGIENHTISSQKDLEEFLTLEKLFRLFIDKGKIFYQMSSEQKELHINLYKTNENNVVLMCGDGSNDCRAILAADIGIALCNKGIESISSHFYYYDISISCVEIVIRTGRACIENMVLICKFILVYGIIQGSSNALLFSINKDFSQSQYLYIDFIVVIILAVLASKSGPDWTQIKREKDENDILSLRFNIFIFGQVFIQILFQVK